MHGGTQPKGPANANFKHGRYSAAMPERLRAHFEDALADPNLITSRGEAAVLETRLAELLAQDQGGSASLWDQLDKVATDFEDAARTGQSAEALAAARSMVAIVRLGKADSSRWAEITRTVDVLRKVKGEERKRVRDAHLVLTVDQAMTLFRALAAAVERHVSDRLTLERIGRDFDRIAEADSARDSSLVLEASQ